MQDLNVTLLTKHLLHHGTKAQSQLTRYIVSGVARRWQVASHLCLLQIASEVPLKGSKEMENTGFEMGGVGRELCNFPAAAL